MVLDEVMVPRARIELALPKKPDFESGASTNSATPALSVIVHAHRVISKWFSQCLIICSFAQSLAFML